MPPGHNAAPLEPWPRHPRPRDGEMLTSWLIRLADANGVGFRCLCRNLCPDRQALREPLDRRPHQDFVDALAARTLTSPDRIRQATIWSLFPAMITEEAPLFGRHYWVLPLANFSRQGGGQQFCHACLAEEDRRHYPLLWRLGFVTECACHEVPLADCCPICHRGKTFVGGGHGRLFNAKDVLTHCLFCGADLTISAMAGPSGSTIETRVLRPHAQALQDRLARALEQGVAEIPDRGLGPSNLLFRGVRQLLRVLLGDRKDGGIERAIREELKESAPVLPWEDRLLPSHFELLNVANRNTLMGVAGWLLESWPDRFVQVMREAKAHKKTLLEDGLDNLPSWYRDVVCEHFSVAHAPWRNPEKPKSSQRSYEALGLRKTSSRLAERECRLRFIREHPELKKDLTALAKAMKAANLYSQKTQIDVITKSIGALVERAFAQDEWWRRAGAPVEHRAMETALTGIVKGTGVAS